MYECPPQPATQAGSHERGTYPICPAHPHRHGESLRAIVSRLQRDLENERDAAPARQIRIPSPTRPIRRTF